MLDRTNESPSVLRTRQVSRGDLRFDVTVGGKPDSPAVLLLHGFPQTSAAWMSTMPALIAAGHRVVAPDQRGYSPGARPSSRRAYRFSELVADALGFADAAGAARFHLVGHDWGGVVAWALAAQRPERVRSLTVLSTPHPAALTRSLIGTQALRSLYAAWFQLPVLAPTALGWHRATLLRAGLRASGLDAHQVQVYADRLDSPEALAAAMAWYQPANAREIAAVGPVDVPTAFLWGDRDPALGPAAARRTGDNVRGPYRFEVLHGASHWLPERHGDLVVPRILEHVAAN